MAAFCILGGNIQHMQYDKECDIVLGMFANRLLPHQFILRLEVSKKLDKHIDVKSQGVGYLILTDIVLSILKSDGFITNNGETYYLTDKGMAFYFTDSYTERSKRWEIENETKKFLYKFRWLTWVLSVIAISISLAAYFKPSKTHIKILPLQEKKCPEELKAPRLQAGRPQNTQSKDTAK